MTAAGPRASSRSRRGDQHVRRALDEGAHHRLALRVGHVVEGGHELVLGVEGHLRDPGIQPPGAVDADAALVGQHDQRALGGVADQAPRRPAGRPHTAPWAAGPGRGRCWLRRRCAWCVGGGALLQAGGARLRRGSPRGAVALTGHREAVLTGDRSARRRSSCSASACRSCRSRSPTSSPASRPRAAA